MKLSLAAHFSGILYSIQQQPVVQLIVFSRVLCSEKHHPSLPLSISFHEKPWLFEKHKGSKQTVPLCTMKYNPAVAAVSRVACVQSVPRSVAVILLQKVPGPYSDMRPLCKGDIQQHLHKFI